MRKSLKYHFPRTSVYFVIDLSCNELFPMDLVVILITSLVAFHLKEKISGKQIMRKCWV